MLNISKLKQLLKEAEEIIKIIEYNESRMVRKTEEILEEMKGTLDVQD